MPHVNTGVDEEIEFLTELRRRIWAGEAEGRPEDITEKLAELFDQRRRARAEQLHGNPSEIIRRARIEAELERMMSE